MNNDQISNIATSLGLKPSNELFLFAVEMQALALMEFSKFCRTGDPRDRFSWTDVSNQR